MRYASHGNNMKYLCIVARKINCLSAFYSLKILFRQTPSTDRIEEQCNNFFFFLNPNALIVIMPFYGHNVARILTAKREKATPRQIVEAGSKTGGDGCIQVECGV